MTFKTLCTVNVCVDVCVIKAHPQALYPGWYYLTVDLFSLGRTLLLSSRKHVVCFKVQTPRPGLTGGSEACSHSHTFGSHWNTLRAVIYVYCLYSFTFYSKISPAQRYCKRMPLSHLPQHLSYNLALLSLTQYTNALTHILNKAVHTIPVGQLLMTLFRLSGQYAM